MATNDLDACLLARVRATALIGGATTLSVSPFGAVAAASPHDAHSSPLLQLRSTGARQQQQDALLMSPARAALLWQASRPWGTATSSSCEASPLAPDASGGVGSLFAEMQQVSQQHTAGACARRLQHPKQQQQQQQPRGIWPAARRCLCPELQGAAAGEAAAATTAAKHLAAAAPHGKQGAPTDAAGWDSSDDGEDEEQEQEEQAAVVLSPAVARTPQAATLRAPTEPPAAPRAAARRVLRLGSPALQPPLPLAYGDDGCGGGYVSSSGSHCSPPAAPPPPHHAAHAASRSRLSAWLSDMELRLRLTVPPPALAAGGGGSSEGRRPPAPSRDDLAGAAGSRAHAICAPALACAASHARCTLCATGGGNGPETGPTQQQQQTRACCTAPQHHGSRKRPLAPATAAAASGVDSSPAGRLPRARMGAGSPGACARADGGGSSKRRSSSSSSHHQHQTGGQLPQPAFCAMGLLPASP